MKVEQRRVGMVDVLTPIGALVDVDAERFQKVLLERLSAPSPRVVLSMQEVPYLDSTALEGLLNAADEMAQRAGTVKLAGLTPTCREILELTGIAPRFSYFKDVNDAVKSFL